jgi:hypothetical protein
MGRSNLFGILACRAPGVGGDEHRQKQRDSPKGGKRQIFEKKLSLTATYCHFWVMSTAKKARVAADSMWQARVVFPRYSFFVALVLESVPSNLRRGLNRDLREGAVL